MNTHRVRIVIDGGVVDVRHVPPGVEIEVIDYDVQDDDCGTYEGTPCERYIMRGDDQEVDPEYDTDAGYQEWAAAQPPGAGNAALLACRMLVRASESQPGYKMGDAVLAARSALDIENGGAA